MSDGILLVLALLAAVAGMAACALANDVHWRQLVRQRAQTAGVRTLCRMLGVALLGLSFLFCVLADPATMAILVWPMLLGVAAAAVAAFLTLDARRRSRG